MIEKTNKNEWPLFRMIIPAFPEINIFTRQAKKTTALGPIMVATVANKLWGWRVEVIDENNYRGPRDGRGLPDHAILQKQNSAQVVGFYCGLTSTMERVWETARFYRQKKVTTIAGGWHAHYCSEETLKHDIDLVVHGDGESSIRKILTSLKRGEPLNNILGTSFLEDGQFQTNQPEFLEEPDLNGLPYSDFSLLKYARIKIYPIGRIRGCSMNCEFCGVKGTPRWASAQHLFDTVSWLVETKKARHFFIVDDRSEQDLGRTVEFFSMIARKYGNRLHFTVQARLESAKNTKLLEIMRDAGVRIVCIGYESPIDEDLRAMRKGFLSSQMLEWTKIWHSYIRWIHAMFIVGYPLKEKQDSIGAKEIIRRFKDFISRASPDTVQILLPGPGPGTDLRLRLEKEGRVFP
ncbi:MAG: cobalamin-dependent protein, partial [bacterium]|nr:cobalamin-dependent protein [bacterium]